MGSFETATNEPMEMQDGEQTVFKEEESIESTLLETEEEPMNSVSNNTLKGSEQCQTFTDNLTEIELQQITTAIPDKIMDLTESDLQMNTLTESHADLSLMTEGDNKITATTKYMLIELVNYFQP